jgi:glycosyl-4,4'-diaponeurosporenoate acyltransferase
VRIAHLARGWTFVLDVAVWAAWSTLAGYLAHVLPATRLDHDTALFRLRRSELDRRLYERRLHVKAWKDRLPEAGALFGGGFSKRHLVRRGRDHLERFVIETRRAELTHWLVMAAAPLFFLWNPWWAGLVMIVYALVANVPCIAIQRYNRARLLRILRRDEAVTR